ncbi:hypothetical protein CH341_21140, partial [Rhodoplanes roseus]
MSLAYDAILARDGASRLRRAGLAAAVAAVVITAMAATGLLDPARFADAWPAVVQLSREMFPPDFSRFPLWLRPLADTLAMSIAGTAIAVGLSLPLALLAAGNTTPNRAVYHVARLMLNLLRSIPELIMGIILVAMVGFGALPGVLGIEHSKNKMVGRGVLLDIARFRG